ncbi:MAG: hypothetical protein L0H63_04200 [Nitrococcus sp.]|nr:hypothetical protein [Nitrococcus sp.]
MEQNPRLLDQVRDRIRLHHLRIPVLIGKFEAAFATRFVPRQAERIKKTLAAGRRGKERLCVLYATRGFNEDPEKY